MNSINREELENALTILTVDGAASNLSNPDAAGHDKVLAALRTVYGNDLPEYMNRYEWYNMNADVRAEYAEDYPDFCEVCICFNCSVIRSAINLCNHKLGR